MTPDLFYSLPEQSKLVIPETEMERQLLADLIGRDVRRANLQSRILRIHQTDTTSVDVPNAFYLVGAIWESEVLTGYLCIPGGIPALETLRALYLDIMETSSAEDAELLREAAAEEEIRIEARFIAILHPWGIDTWLQLAPSPLTQSQTQVYALGAADGILGLHDSTLFGGTPLYVPFGTQFDRAWYPLSDTALEDHYPEKDSEE